MKLLLVFCVILLVVISLEAKKLKVKQSNEQGQVVGAASAPGKKGKGGGKGRKGGLIPGADSVPVAGGALHGAGLPDAGSALSGAGKAIPDASALHGLGGALGGAADHKGRKGKGKKGKGKSDKIDSAQLQGKEQKVMLAKAGKGMIGISQKDGQKQGVTGKSGKNKKSASAAKQKQKQSQSVSMDTD